MGVLIFFLFFTEMSRRSEVLHNQAQTLDFAQMLKALSAGRRYGQTTACFGNKPILASLYVPKLEISDSLTTEKVEILLML